MTSHIDRQGREIGQNEWKALYAQDGYRIVATKDVGPATILTSWIGWACAREGAHPMLYLTEALERQGTASLRSLAGPVWSGTELEALAAHRLMVENCQGLKPPQSRKEK